jgi:hypothetical protein
MITKMITIEVITKMITIEVLTIEMIVKQSVL